MDIFLHGILPAFLLAISVGQIYAFTNFATDLSTTIGICDTAIQLAFSFGIFFLGMGAATFGPIVEKDIKKAAVIGTVLFLLGLVLTQLSVLFKEVSLLHLGYGLLLGLGTGVIYVTPVKTMMLWLPKWKAVASALPIIFFGLGSTLSTIIYTQISSVGIDKIFWIFAAIYAVMMIIGGILLKKPDGVEEQLHSLTTEEFSFGKTVTNWAFIHAWVFMFLNITAGLCLIPLAKQMMIDPAIGYSLTAVSVFVALSGVFNGGGRFIFALMSDKLKTRLNIIFIISMTSLLFIDLPLIIPMSIGVVLLVINACYGAGFSVIPAILSEKFGMANISKIHGMVLTAWGFAGLFGNQLALIMNEHGGVKAVIVMIAILHGLNVINYIFWKKSYAK